MGAGKTTLAKELSGLWQLPFFDTDQMIEDKSSLSVPQIFNQFGEDYFRKLESDILEKFSQDKPAVISCGGGLPCFGDNLHRMLTMGTVWWLHTPPEILLKRLKVLKDRPLAHNVTNEAIMERYRQRLPFYQQAHAELIEL